jgi:hypothetical protein
MQCKACSTRIDPGHSVCPNCGRTTGPTLTAKPAPAAKKASSGARSKSGAQGKSGVQDKSGAQEKTAEPAKVSAREAVAKAIDLELEEIAEVLDEAPGESASSLYGEQGLGPKASELRAILAEQPGLLEPDLSVFTGKKRGVRFPTDVGEIDLLLIDDEQNLVVVSIPDPESPGDLVSEILQRIGWVRKHVAKEQQEVRGVVLLPPMPEDLSYAAAAVAGTVAFHTYRMSISFDELEL